MPNQPLSKILSKTHRVRRPIGAFEITCVLIGAAAVGLASFAHFNNHGQNGAPLILIAAAGLLGVLMRGVSETKCN
jgi:hypothetical protein